MGSAFYFLCSRYSGPLTPTARMAIIVEFANRVDPDESAHNELFHLHLLSLSSGICFLNMT